MTEGPKAPAPVLQPWSAPMGPHPVYPPRPTVAYVPRGGFAAAPQLAGFAALALFVAQVFGLAACAFAAALFVMGPLVRADALPGAAQSARAAAAAATTDAPGPERGPGR
jgi:hypothetical protein